MLGVVHIKQTVVDVWQGASKDFFCDYLLLLEDKQGASVDLFRDFIVDKQKRHLAVAFADIKCTRESIADICKLCIKASDKELVDKRLSFLVTTRQEYDLVCESIDKLKLK
jgi:hypothetical protein